MSAQHLSINRRYSTTCKPVAEPFTVAEPYLLDTDLLQYFEFDFVLRITLLTWQLVQIKDEQTIEDHRRISIVALETDSNTRSIFSSHVSVPLAITGSIHWSKIFNLRHKCGASRTLILLTIDLPIHWPKRSEDADSVTLQQDEGTNWLRLQERDGCDWNRPVGETYVC